MISLWRRGLARQKRWGCPIFDPRNTIYLYTASYALRRIKSISRDCLVRIRREHHTVVHANCRINQREYGEHLKLLVTTLLIDDCGWSCPLTRWPKNPALCDATYVCLGIERKIEGSTVLVVALAQDHMSSTDRGRNTCMHLRPSRSQSRFLLSHECAVLQNPLGSYNS